MDAFFDNPGSSTFSFVQIESKEHLSFKYCSHCWKLNGYWEWTIYKSERPWEPNMTVHFSIFHYRQIRSNGLVYSSSFIFTKVLKLWESSTSTFMECPFPGPSIFWTILFLDRPLSTTLFETGKRYSFQILASFNSSPILFKLFIRLGNRLSLRATQSVSIEIHSTLLISTCWPHVPRWVHFFRLRIENLTLIVKSWKTHPEIFLRPFYWKTHPLK